MKKSIIVFVVTFLLVCLISCNENQEVEIISGNESYSFVVEKNGVLNESLFANFEFTLDDLYYDEAFTSKYNGEPITENIKLYVKEDVTVEEYVDINININEKTITISLVKDSILNKDLLIEYNIDIENLYYDKGLTSKYNGEPITENTNLYVKEDVTVEEYVDIKIIINEKIVTISLVKDSSLNKDLLSEYNIDIENLYYDERLTSKYNGEPINKDMILYFCEKVLVKIINGEQFIELHLLKGENVTRDDFEKIGINVTYVYKDVYYNDKYLEDKIYEDTTLYVREKITWTNDNAVYCQYKSEDVNQTISNLDIIFETLEYKELFVVEKSEYSTFLFILNDNNQDEFISKLKMIDNVLNVYVSLDVPFDKIDTTYLESRKEEIKVGEEVKISIKGVYKQYNPRFTYYSVDIKLLNQDDTLNYTLDDFKGYKVTNVSGKTFDNSIVLDINEFDIFGLVYFTDALARNNDITSVLPTLFRSEQGMFDPDHDYWTFSVDNIIDFGEGFSTGFMESCDDEGYFYCNFVGLNPGKVTLKYNDFFIELEIEIDVIE